MCSEFYQLIKVPLSMKHEGFIPCSQKPINRSYSEAKPVLFPHSHFFLWSSLIPSSHLHLGFPCSLLLLSFLTKILHAFHITFMNTTYPTNLIVYKSESYNFVCMILFLINVSIVLVVSDQNIQHFCIAGSYKYSYLYGFVL